MSHLDSLNPPQQKAVTAIHGPILVLAGPGSGKTRVLTHRIAYLIDDVGVDPWRIMAVTFTNKASDAMRERTEALLSMSQGVRGLTLGTFHRICARFLRIEAEQIGLNPRYVIFDSDDQLQVVKQSLKDLNIDDKRNSPYAVHSAISRAKNELITPDEYPIASYRDEVIARVYERYQTLLTVSGGLDFDDLLMKAVFMLRDHEDIREKYQRRFEYILVDEFQDTNTAQYELVRLLAAGHRNVFVVGDEDQSIYRWRGADFRNVQRFKEDYAEAEVILLEQNYRSTQTILDAANAVISQNQHRTPKQLFTDRGQGGKIRVHQAYDEHDEGNFILDEIVRLQEAGEAKPGQCAVMYRTNAQSRVLEETFVRRGMPYRLVGATRFYSRREIKDIMAYMRLVHNPDDDISMQRIINIPPRRIGKTTLNKLSSWSAGLGVSLYNALRILGGDAEPALAALADSHPLAKRARGDLLNFYAMLQDWIDAREILTPAQLLDRILDESGYREWLRDGSEEGEGRWENVLELRVVSTAYDDMPLDVALDALLEEVALVSDTDDYRSNTDIVTLLTLHSAKGLEFGVVFMTGLEEGLLPHSRSLEDPDQMEEERRLAYVGITRAKDRLYVLHTFRRTTWGRSEMSESSRFLGDLPKNLTSGDGVKQKAHRRMTSWGSGGGGGLNVPKPKRAAPVSGLRFSPGQRVHHPRFGEGIVVMSRLSGDDEEVSVAFTGRGVKRLLASFANLQILK